ncbi:MAG TPA: hypothetical protein PKH10_07650 [bacterium]|nr:hypothetical protein [bacterium]
MVMQNEWWQGAVCVELSFMDAGRPGYHDQGDEDEGKKKCAGTHR